MKALFAIMLVVFLECTSLGMGFAVIPLFVTDILQYSNGVVGIVTGIQFIVSMLFRFPSGRISDVKGPYFAMFLGVVSAVAGGVFYVGAGFASFLPALSLCILFLGSILLGISQSVLVTGTMACGVLLIQIEKEKNALNGDEKKIQGAGSVISWIGMCVFGGLILGVPLGTMLFQWSSLQLAGAVIAFLSLFIVVWCWQKAQKAKPSFVTSLEESVAKDSNWAVLGKALKIGWFPGFCFGLGAMGHGLFVAYGELLYEGKGWTPLWLPFALFGAGLILARMFFGSLPDRLGGGVMAVIAGVLEALGIGIVAFSSHFYVTAFGIFLSGFAFAFVFPAFALMTLARGDQGNKGALIGVCNALGDGVRGVGIVLFGYVTFLGGFELVFFFGAVLSLLSGAGGLWLFLTSQKDPKQSV